MDKQIKELIKTHNLSDEDIVKALNTYKQAAEESLAGEQEEGDAGEEESPEEEAEQPSEETPQTDIKKLVALEVAKVLKGIKGIPRAKPVPKKGGTTIKDSYSGFGMMP